MTGEMTMKLKNEVEESSKKKLKEYRIFGNRFTEKEYGVILSGIKKLRKKNLNNTDILLTLLKKEVRNTLKDNIYELKNRIYALEKKETEKILKLYFEIKEKFIPLPQPDRKKYGIIDFEFTNIFDDKYSIVIFDKNKKNLKERIIACSKKAKIILWDPENICKIKNIERIDIDDVNFFIEQFKHIIFSPDKEMSIK